MKRDARVSSSSTDSKNACSSALSHRFASRSAEPLVRRRSSLAVHAHLVARVEREPHGRSPSRVRSVSRRRGHRERQKLVRVRQAEPQRRRRRDVGVGAPGRDVPGEAWLAPLAELEPQSVRGHVLPAVPRQDASHKSPGAHHLRARAVRHGRIRVHARALIRREHLRLVARQDRGVVGVVGIEQPQVDAPGGRQAQVGVGVDGRRGGGRERAGARAARARRGEEPPPRGAETRGRRTSRTWTRSRTRPGATPRACTVAACAAPGRTARAPARPPSSLPVVTALWEWISRNRAAAEKVRANDGS